MAGLEGDLRDRLRALDEAGRYRRLDALGTAQGTEIAVDGRRYLNFCSNDYLGLANHPQIREAVHDAVETFGVGSGGAALLSGRSTAHVELEGALSAYLRRDRALVFSSGYLANIGLVGALVGRSDDVFSDRLNHASLIDAVRLSRAKTHRYAHLDLGSLAEQLTESSATRKWVLTDCVFSMDGDIAPLSELAELCAESGAVLIGDDAHGFGVLGDGRGTTARFSIDQGDMPAVVVTFSKALGTVGAAVVGSEVLIETLIQSARTFMFDTAPPAALAVATTKAIELLSTEAWRRQRLLENIAYFRNGAVAAGLALLDSETPIQPIMIGDDRRAVTAAAELQRQGIYVRVIRPPTVPPGTARLRVGLSADHTETQIERLTAALADVLSRDNVR